MDSMYPGFGSSHPPATQFFQHMEAIVGKKVYPFSSARAALVFGLRALGLSRLDEIWVPAYLSHCVLSAIARITMPALSPSKRTKAVLAWDPYGFPTQRDALQEEAEKHNWHIINDCAHSLYGKNALHSIDTVTSFDVYSLPKIFPCGLGGALCAYHWKIQDALDKTYEKLSHRHAERSNQARRVLESSHSVNIRDDIAFDVEGVFGYLPEVVAFPGMSLQSLPESMTEITLDRQRRERIWQTISRAFPDRVPGVEIEGFAPFAIPLKGDGAELERLSKTLLQELSIDAPVLHFDFALNMMAPAFQPALMIGCHHGWTEEVTDRALACLKDLRA